jgi:hypothetical protein
MLHALDHTGHECFCRWLQIIIARQCLCRPSSCPGHVLPLLERALSSLHASKSSVPQGSAAEQQAAAEQLSAAIQGMTHSRRALATMSSSRLSRLCCAFSALSALCALQDQADDADMTLFLPHMDAALDVLLERIPVQLDAASKLGAAAHARCLSCAARCAARAQGLLLLRSSIGGSNVRTRLRGLLSCVSKHSQPPAATQADSQHTNVWGWDIRQDASASDLSRDCSEPKLILCQQLAHLLAACCVQQR